MEKLNYNCTLAEFARQLNIELWQAMELGKYFRNRYFKDKDKIEKFLRRFFRADYLDDDYCNENKRIDALVNALMKFLSKNG